MKTRSSCLAGWVAAFGLLRAAAVDAQFVIDESPPRQSASSAERKTAISVPAPAGEAGSVGGNPAASGDTAVIKFLNEDRLHGILTAIEPAEFGLRWTCRASSKPVDFLLDDIASVSLPVGRGREAKTAALVRLTNGDALSGNVVSLDKESLVLDAWYAGKISLRRSMVKTILPGKRGAGVIFEGPTELKSWVMAGRQDGVESWRLKNGALYAIREYPIGRYIENMPDVAQIEFEIGWRDYPELYFWLYAGNLEQQGQSGCYLVRFSGGHIYFMRQTPNAGQKNLGQVEVPQFANRQRGKARICILVSKKDRRFVLMIDGRVTREFQDSEPFAGTGNGIQLQSQRQGLMTVRNIRISEWDGGIPQPAAAEEERKDDLVGLANGDKISGTLKAIAEGKARVETRFGDMEIPLERIQVIHSATGGAERARRNKGDVKAVFADGGQITIEIARLGGGRIEGRSENFGAVKMPVEAFKLLEFNIYRERAKSEDDDLDMDRDGAPIEDGVIICD